ncbi:MAG TPA: nucleotidyltransferase [Desulfobacterales bacterium]|nr:nucleotidyltransferase [Desulfobacterales bacterium]
MKQIKDIRKTLKDHRGSLGEEYGLTEIGLFGSYVRGTQKESSDIDILVGFRRAVGLIAFVHLKNRLTELLGIRVDMVMKKALKPKIGKSILDEVVYL